MNPLLVEKAVVDTLMAQAFTGHTIYLGSDYDERDPQSLNIIVSVDHIESFSGSFIVGNETSQTGTSRLYNADLVVRLESPALLGASAMSTLGVAMGNLSSAMNSSYFASKWTSSEVEFNGITYKSTDKSSSAHQWIVEVRASLGVSIFTGFFHSIPIQQA
jgi:hypothetical protein